MKKKIGASLLAFWILCMPVTAFAAEAPAERGTEQAAEFAAPKYGTKKNNPEKEALAQQVNAMTTALQETVDALAAATYGHNVSVDNYSDPDAMGLIYESQGSGIILSIDENVVCIATAAHCLKHENTEVVFADGTRCDTIMCYKNAARDVGFLLVDKAAIPAGTLQVITPAQGADAENAGKVHGDLLFALSSGETPNQKTYPGVLDSYSVVYPNNPSQNVMQFYSNVSYGSSGGAVYTPEGIWVGSVSGGDTFGTCWAVPYSDVLEEFGVWMEMAQQQAAQNESAG